ncbi:tRNA epoxyqueuosine(34) reductase QueG [bacterium]|nr:tRNA epoxyqueuosine(34) reductase QueG [bacterium]
MINDLRKSAYELGLAALGIAPAIDEVRTSFAWAKSVVTTAVCYLPPETSVSDDTPRALVARIARSADYHDVLHCKLAHMVEQIKAVYPNAHTQICVDTSPLPERKLAVLSGIASRAKNANVFVDGCGSYAALGEIVTDIELPVSQPNEIDLCGSCEKCIRACPMGAIIAPGAIDKSKCLSAITQSGGIVPVETRHAMGNRIYGCDRCQEVCPHNASVRVSAPEFAQDVFPGACPELIPLIRISAREFKENVKRTSIGWIGRTKIRRNAIIAAGNIKCEEAVPALKEVMQGECAALREYAVWAIGNYVIELQD